MAWRPCLDFNRPHRWLASGQDHPCTRDLLRNLVVGFLGSVLAGFLFGKLAIHFMPDFWGELITAAIGAVVVR